VGGVPGRSGVKSVLGVQLSLPIPPSVNVYWRHPDQAYEPQAEKKQMSTQQLLAEAKRKGKWRWGNGSRERKHLLSAAGRRYRRSVYLQLRGEGFLSGVINGQEKAVLDERLGLMVRYHFPDNRVRDLDNFLKGLLDSLKYCRLIRDDSLFDKIYVDRGAVRRGGGELLMVINKPEAFVMGYDNGGATIGIV